LYFVTNHAKSCCLWISKSTTSDRRLGGRNR